MRPQPDRLLLALALVLGGGGLWLGLSNDRGAPATVCPAGAEHLARIELIFGLSRKERPDVGETDWRAFIDREITPRFPEGLTTLAGEGQWRTSTGAIVKEPARMLLVWARSAPDLGARVEAVRVAWKTAHDQESVLRAESVSCVSF